MFKLAYGVLFVIFFSVLSISFLENQASLAPENVCLGCKDFEGQIKSFPGGNVDIWDVLYGSLGPKEIRDDFKECQKKLKDNLKDCGCSDGELCSIKIETKNKNWTYGGLEKIEKICVAAGGYLGTPSDGALQRKIFDRARNQIRENQDGCYDMEIVLPLNNCKKSGEAEYCCDVRYKSPTNLDDNCVNEWKERKNLEIQMIGQYCEEQQCSPSEMEEI